MNGTEKVQENQEQELPVTRLYSMRDAAKLVNIGYPVLLAAAQSGQLRAIAVGSHYRVTARALNAYVLALENAETKLPTAVNGFIRRS